MTFIILDSQGELLFTNGGATCLNCLKDNEDKSYCRITCPDDTEERRFGKRVTKEHILYLCSKHVTTKTTKLFNEKIEMLTYSLPSMIQFKKEIEKTVQQIELEKYTKIVHNLKTLNAQSINALYSFIPQEVFTEHYDNLLEYLTQQVKSHPKDAAIAIMRQAKNNAHMKTEFSSHEKMAMEKPILLSKYHVIRTVILNVYHSFDYDFKAKKVNLRIDNSDVKAFFDYETIRLALYHIFSNAVKYICDNSNLLVHILENTDTVFIEFEMKSFYISPEERNTIFEDHVSGGIVTKKNLNGSGLGMGLIKKALTMNKGNIEVIPGEKRINSDYSQNIFRFILPKK